uniref:Protein kinase domain-containing protein n=1 Tax=Anopheles dirus TaxID=7168 RepID=A0A182NNX5_9DIPT
PDEPAGAGVPDAAGSGRTADSSQEERGAPVGPTTGSSAAAVPDVNANVAILNRLLASQHHMSAGGNGGLERTAGNSGGPAGNGGRSASSSTNSSHHKACPYHRACSTHHLHHLHRCANGQAHAGASSATSGSSSFSRYRSNAGNGPSSSSASYPVRDAISTNVTPPPLNAIILVDRYLLMEPVEGNNLYRCFDIKSHEELVCKIANNPCSNLLTAHFRLDGHPHVNALHKVIQGNNQTYLLFSPSEGDLHSYVRVRKRLREPEARRLCRQMCEVVKSCHEQGIVLRDLKLRKFVFADRER